jgi:hypothetical protein
MDVCAASATTAARDAMRQMEEIRNAASLVARERREGGCGASARNLTGQVAPPAAR